MLQVFDNFFEYFGVDVFVGVIGVDELNVVVGNIEFVGICYNGGEVDQFVNFIE